jgi:fructose-specific component phosphotransferase system IIB-like protein
MSLGDVAAFLLVAVLTAAAFWRGHFWVGLILLALLSGMGLLL